MKTSNLNKSLSNWVDELLSRGRTAFSLHQAKAEFSGQSDISIKRSLSRLSLKGKVISIFKGYYLIIPPQYALFGVLPPSMYIDGLMSFLERPYYVGLLNAAAFYGSAHQRPQEFFVFTSLPALRPTQKKDLKVNFVSKTTFPDKLLESRKTETGYLKISSPELTACDLIQFEKRIGGLNRASTVINEMAEEMNPDHFDKELFSSVPVFTVQRLGYILEHVVDKQALADRLYAMAMQAGLKFYRIPIKKTGSIVGFPFNDRWKLIINSEIEID